MVINNSGVLATLAFAFQRGQERMNIWYQRSLTTTIKSTIDGLIFAFLMAGTFGWLWPR